MAITTDQERTNFEPIDPSADSGVEDVQVAIPDLRGIDLHRSVFNYDRDSDILLFYLYGKERPAAAAGGSANFYALMDPDSEEFLGIQVEDFLARAVKDRPSLLDVLDVAELQGMTLADVHRTRQEVLGYHGRFRAWLNRFLALPWQRQSIKWRIASELVKDERLRPAEPLLPATQRGEMPIGG